MAPLTPVQRPRMAKHRAMQQVPVQAGQVYFNQRDIFLPFLSFQSPTNYYICEHLKFVLCI